MHARAWMVAALLMSLLVLAPLVSGRARAQAASFHIVSDGTAKYSYTEVPGWEALGFDDSAWPFVVAPSAGLCPPSVVPPEETTHPIWGEDPQEFQTIFVRKTFTLDAAAAANVIAGADDDYDLFINGVFIGGNHDGATNLDLYTNVPLQAGLNVLAMRAIDVVGVCQWLAFDVFPPTVNDELSGAPEPETTVYDPTPVPDGPAGTFSFTAEFCNIGTNQLTQLTSVTTTLTSGNVLLNRDTDTPPGVRSELMFPANRGYADLMLDAGECVDVPYTIGLATPSSFQFFVDVLGVSAPACVQPPEGLVSWWPGDGHAEDIANGNDGTLQAGTTFAPGMAGQAFSFDGVDDFVEVPDAPSVNIGTGDFSLDAWIRTSIPDLQVITDKRVGTMDHPLGYAFFVGGLGLGFQLANGDFTNFDSGVFVQDGNFHHVAVTVRRGSPDGGKLFVDGAVILTFDPRPYASNLDHPADFRIGAATLEDQYPADSFRGLIDELEFFKRALTDAEVQAIFTAGSAGKCEDGSTRLGMRSGALTPPVR